MLLHGGGLSWWHFREIAHFLQDSYHVILPILNGHAGSDKVFTTIEENAAEIIAWIDKHLCGRVLMIGGASLGAQVLLEMLSQRGDICRYAIVESALVIPSKLTHAMIRPAFGSCYGLIRRRWFARLQFISLHIKSELFEDYYRDTCAVAKADLIAFLQANTVYALKKEITRTRAVCMIFVGEKESRSMQRSAKMIQDAICGSTLHVLPDMYHGEFSLNDSAQYAKYVIENLK